MHFHPFLLICAFVSSVPSLFKQNSSFTVELRSPVAPVAPSKFSLASTAEVVFGVQQGGFHFSLDTSRREVSDFL